MSDKAIDIVCGMELDKKSAAAKSEYKGKTYYFMSLGNKQAFEEDPVKFVEGAKQEMTGDSGMTMKM